MSNDSYKSALPGSGKMYKSDGTIINIADAITRLACGASEILSTNQTINNTGVSAAMIGMVHRGVPLPNNPIANRTKITIKHTADGTTVKLLFRRDAILHDYTLTDNTNYSFDLSPTADVQVWAISSGTTTVDILEEA